MSRPARRALSVSLAVLLLGAVVLVPVVALPSWAASQNAAKQTFEQRLLTGLRVKTPSDKAFITRVVALVRDRRLPTKLVDQTYFWARKKANSRGGAIAQNPMVYFRPGMTARAKAIGVRI